jgi:hypothetical protein
MVTGMNAQRKLAMYSSIAVKMHDARPIQKIQFTNANVCLAILAMVTRAFKMVTLRSEPTLGQAQEKIVWIFCYKSETMQCRKQLSCECRVLVQQYTRSPQLQVQAR